jgi:hypothetical protein
VAIRGHPGGYPLRVFCVAKKQGLWFNLSGRHAFRHFDGTQHGTVMR